MLTHVDLPEPSSNPTSPRGLFKRKPAPKSDSKRDLSISRTLSGKILSKLPSCCIKSYPMEEKLLGLFDGSSCSATLTGGFRSMGPPGHVTGHDFATLVFGHVLSTVQNLL
ncbi:unnamed protein product [Kuraishia capsulata CBS 1993]|uniref:Uncharacterized protein n=1 Tax=Kuraishia capsulata CBS 1993 TaxID=1382522 RepID=W6MHS4_9ASCO|nr:uncharacterized protein KUCA_T00001307001 [Kuraishia capsulata CBS 1993]CDK25338.1 unnamed protein product [Kuraishia capsulata CBS 1993]